jgi:hypothetical protein
MEMTITSARLVILIAMLMVVTMVGESSASRPLQLKFIFRGDEMENNNNNKMKNGWFESFGALYLRQAPLIVKNLGLPMGRFLSS